MILGDASALFNGNLLAGLALVLTVALTCVKLFGRKPPIEAEFVSKVEFHRYQEQVRQDMKEISTKLDESFATLDTKRSRQVAALHDDIRQVDIKLATLIGKLGK